MDTGEKIAIGILGVILIIIVTGTHIDMSAEHVYVGEVVAYQQVSGIVTYTSVVMKTYSETAMVFIVEGRHTFELGTRYRIVTQGQGIFSRYPYLVDAKILTEASD